MGTSPETVKRDWKMAKAWLYGVMAEERDDASSKQPDCCCEIPLPDTIVMTSHQLRAL
jgi:hypothetical protein